MLTAYFDESFDGADSHAVVAGFMGSPASWAACVKRWTGVLQKYNRTSLHMKTLRVRTRHEQMLKDLGSIPERCGLRLIVASVNVGVYRDSVKGKVIEVGSEGYLFALQIAVLSALHHVPKGERLEVIFEQQIPYANRRENILATCAVLPEFLDSNGRSKLAKWSSITKNTILEPSDLAAYAALQHLRDRKSEKANLCAPILETKL